MAVQNKQEWDDQCRQLMPPELMDMISQRRAKKDAERTRLRELHLPRLQAAIDSHPLSKWMEFDPDQYDGSLYHNVVIRVPGCRKITARLSYITSSGEWIWTQYTVYKLFGVDPVFYDVVEALAESTIYDGTGTDF